MKILWRKLGQKDNTACFEQHHSQGAYEDIFTPFETKALTQNSKSMLRGNQVFLCQLGCLWTHKGSGLYGSTRFELKLTSQGTCL